MAEIAELIKSAGSSGLLERLDSPTTRVALANFQQLIDAVKAKKYLRVQGIGDDFVPDADFYNVLGAIYPILNRRHRDEAFGAVLTQLDRVNYMYVNMNHTPTIREQLLLADIGIARGLYWPGLHDQEGIWAGKKSFVQVQREFMADDGLFRADKVKSDFLVAYALMRKDFTCFGEDYARAAHPEFLRRVMKGIVAMRFAGAKNEKDVEIGRARLYELLPPNVHDMIEPLREEAGWVDRTKFP